MSKQEVIYTEVKCHTSEQQRRQRPGNSESKDSPTPSSPWWIIAVILGVLYLISLGAVVALIAKFFQDSHPSENFGQLGNAYQQQQTKTPGQESHKETGGSKFSPCPENWRQHGDYCYHFPTTWKTWQESKDYCLSSGSNLLKIENKEELDFIKSVTFTYHWIGLSHKTDNESWVWGDDTAFTSDLFTVTQHGTLQHCVLFLNRGAKSDFCDKRNPCICEKKAVHTDPTAMAEEG
ncbi:natural killer cells antigen CD94-like [Lepidochelys kempii]|uniref:natural killer cells antigen CD94-like n=1 Tax=Lepidochelys kempii TaxID=8472 RepID=UPI003C6F1924